MREDVASGVRWGGAPLTRPFLTPRDKGRVPSGLCPVSSRLGTCCWPRGGAPPQAPADHFSGPFWLDPTRDPGPQTAAMSHTPPFCRRGSPVARAEDWIQRAQVPGSVETSTRGLSSESRGSGRCLPGVSRGIEQKNGLGRWAGRRGETTDVRALVADDVRGDAARGLKTHETTKGTIHF